MISCLRESGRWITIGSVREDKREQRRLGKLEGDAGGRGGRGGLYTMHGKTLLNWEAWRKGDAPFVGLARTIKLLLSHPSKDHCHHHVP
jgi:hypothetical protein